MTDGTPKCRVVRISGPGTRQYVRMPETMAESSTRLLREGKNPLHVRLRVLLADKGIDGSTCVLAAFFPDDTNMEFGVVVTPERQVYEFDFYYGPGDLTNRVATAYIGDWRDSSDWWQSSPSRGYVEDALSMLDRPRLPTPPVDRLGLSH